MLRIKLGCTGTSDLLMDPKTPEILEAIRTGIRKPDTVKITGESKKETAEKKLIETNGHLGIPAIYFTMSLINAGKNKKYKKEMNLTTSDGSFVTSLMSIEENFLVLVGDGKWIVDERPVPTRPGCSQVNIRPRFPKWGFEATLAVNDEMLSEKIAKKLVEEAGVFIGVGAARKLGFGRFKIAKWEKIK